MAKKKNTKKTKAKKQTKKQNDINSEVASWISIVLIFAVVIVAYTQMGVVGVALSRLFRFLFGKFYFVMMGLIAIQILITTINRHSGNTDSKNPLAMLCIICGMLLWCALSDTSKDLTGVDILLNYTSDLGSFFTSEPAVEVGGGIIGTALLSLTTFLVDRNGTILVIVVLFIIAALLLVNLQVYKQAFHTVISYFSVEGNTDDDEEQSEEEEEETFEPEIEDVPKELPRVSNQPVMIEADRDSMTENTALRLDEEKYTAAPELTEDDVSEPVLFNEPVKKETPAYEEAPVHTSSGIFLTADDPNVKLVKEENQPQEEKPQEGLLIDDTVEEMEEELPEEKPVTAEQAQELPEPPAVKRNKPYKLPDIKLLDPIPPKDKAGVNETAAKEKGELLIQTLRNFDIEAQLIDTHIGPAVTKFEIRPLANVKVSRILNLNDDIKMQLAVRDVRLEAPIPGHNAVGVEIPNQIATPVKMKELIHTIPDKEKDQKLLIILGKDLMGNTVTCRLDKMPHLLIAGATGTGKSVCMNSIITSLLLRTKPDEVKLLLVDPKKVEFTPYQKIPHLIGPVINDPAKANNALKVIVKIMDERYDAFSKAGVRNIQGYNEKVETMEDPANGSPKPKKFPYIVVIVDEMADLMAVAGKEVESSIQRITQLARAAGIHLIVATQRPSTDVITGIIKANIPSRIAFSVSSGIDSRTILDHVGAERLLGNGDMLYMPIGASNATRVQGVFVTDEEVQKITEFVSSEAVPMYDDSFIRLEGINDEEGGIGGVASAEEDPLYEEVKAYVIDVQKASTSLLQRRFGIGYNRAARMIDLLESNGIIGPAQGSKPREVFAKKEED